MHLKDPDGMANSVDPDQSDLGLLCLFRPICPYTQNFYITLFLIFINVSRNLSRLLICMDYCKFHFL